MTATSKASTDPLPRCWCCGDEYDEQDLTRLGDHPEVAICFGCAQFLQRRAKERYGQSHPSLAATVNTRVANIREWVIRHDWHSRPLIGPLLRWINRLLP